MAAGGKLDDGIRSAGLDYDSREKEIDDGSKKAKQNVVRWES